MDRSFVDDKNIIGLLDVMDSYKINKKPRIEQMFLDDEIIRKYIEKEQAIEDELLKVQQKYINTVKKYSQQSEHNTIQSIQLNINNSVAQKNEQSSKQNSAQYKKTTSKKLSKQLSKYSLKSSESEYVRQINDSPQIQYPQNLLNEEVFIIDKIQKPLYSQTEMVKTEMVKTQMVKTEKYVDSPANEHLRLELIDQVQQIHELLRSENVKKETLPQYDKNMSIRELQTIYDIMQKRKKQVQTKGIVDDAVLILTKSIEHVFDGKTSILGWKPDLTGISGPMQRGLKTHEVELCDWTDQRFNQIGVESFGRLCVRLGSQAVKRSVLNKMRDKTTDISNNMSIVKKISLD